MRTCYNCQEEIPPETTHFILNDEVYCESCVDETSHIAYSYFVGGEYMGSSAEDCRKIEDYEDDYEEEESA